METRRDFPLNLASLQPLAEFIDAQLTKARCVRRDLIRARLFAEETTVYWIRQAQPDALVQVIIRKRFRTITLVLRYAGNQANPMAWSPEEPIDKPEIDLISQNILIGLSSVQYTYENATNQLTFTVTQKPFNPMLAIVLALTGGISCGLLGLYLAPDQAAALPAGLFAPLTSAYMGLLNSIVGPLLFISIIAGILNMQSLARIRQVFGTLFGWFAKFTLAAVILTLLAAWIYFPVDGLTSGGGSSGRDLFRLMSTMILGAIPANLVRPFMEGHTLQIIFMASLSGIVVLILKERMPTLTVLVAEADSILMKLLNAICSWMPGLIFVSAISLTLAGEGRSLLQATGLFLFILVFVLLMTALMLLVLAFSGQRPLPYLRLMVPVLLPALTTASSSATFIHHDRVAIHKQGIRSFLVKFSIPIGAQLCRPYSLIGNVLTTLFISHYYQVPFGLAEILIVIVLCGVLLPTIPSTPGVVTFMYTVLFNQLGIPLEGLVIAATIDLLTDYFLTPGNVLVTNASMSLTELALRRAAKKMAADIAARP